LAARQRRRPAWGKLGLLALSIAALMAAWRYTPLATYVAPQRIIAFARWLGSVKWAPLAVAAAYTPAAFVMFPRPLLSLLAIVAFGLWLGGACVVAGVLGAALSTYYIGRLLPSRTVRRLAGAKFERFTGLLREHGVLTIFAANLLPTPPFAVQGIMAGAIRIPLTHYAAGTLLSLLPGLVAVLLFGHQIIVALEDPSNVSYVVVASTAVGFAVAMVLAGRWSARRARMHDA
jgi:phospholipase D1/2